MSTTVYSPNLKKEADRRKLFNIKVFSRLDRTGLSFDGIERRLLIREYETGEKLYIQYPGKESVQRGTRNPRPWDFRPKMLLPDGTWMKDLSFKDVWDDLYSFKDLDMDMSHIASLFFRIAFMVDTKLASRKLAYEDVDARGNIVKTGTIEMEWYEYNPDDEVLGDVEVPKSAIRNCSFLPYLAYNDLLAQNEDCKYYYRDVCEREGDWKPDIGRRNTLLSHMSVIAFIEGKLRFTEITDMFQRGMGVAPLSAKLWEETTKGKVRK